MDLAAIAAWGGLLSFAGTAALAVVIYFLNRIQAERIEHLRDELRGLAFERETRFATLHGRQVELLSEIYAKLKLAEWEINALVSTIHPPDEPGEVRAERAKAAFVTLGEVVGKNRFLLDETLGKQLSEFQTLVTNVWLIAGNRLSTERMRDREGNVWRETLPLVSEAIPEVRNQIEERMRQLVGMGASSND